jgi:hypothetical protein
MTTDRGSSNVRRDNVRKWLVCLAGSLAAAVGVWGADVETAPLADTPLPASGVSLAGDSSTLELSWDNGTLMSFYPTTRIGGIFIVGNDFDTSTLKTTHLKILKFKLFTSGLWPNAEWDGFGICFFDFRRGMPGEMLWPTSKVPYFFKPSVPRGHVWVECEINWTCPTPAFVAAYDLKYDYPNCDPFAVDNNETYRVHSWQYKHAFWSGLSLPYYRNLMLRVIVETGSTFPGVAPTSLGRVKALYY